MHFPFVADAQSPNEAIRDFVKVSSHLLTYGPFKSQPPLQACLLKLSAGLPGGYLVKQSALHFSTC